MFTKVIALTLAAAAAVQAGRHHNGTVTEVVDIWTTYCPEPTHITMNNRTYTVTEACTFTISDCPCTITKALPTAPANKPGAPANSPANTPAAPTVAPGSPGAPTVVGGAGQNAAAYGMALAGAIAAAAVAL